MNMDNWVSQSTRISELETRVARLEALLTQAQDTVKRLEKHPLFGSIARMFAKVS